MQQDEAFETLFDIEFERCVRVARRIVLTLENAQDVACEAFARAWAQWPALSSGRPGAWVVKVTINLAIDAVRRRTPQTDGIMSVPSIEDDIVVRLPLFAALRTLPAQQRVAIVLRYLADYSEQDVAAALQVSPGTVKTHLHRGIARLRGSLDPVTLEGLQLAEV